MNRPHPPTNNPIPGVPRAGADVPAINSLVIEIKLFSRAGGDEPTADYRLLLQMACSPLSR
jgi:hypothetical protein